jgi:hypothetical protein
MRSVNPFVITSSHCAFVKTLAGDDDDDNNHSIIIVRRRGIQEDPTDGCVEERKLFR